VLPKCDSQTLLQERASTTGARPHAMNWVSSARALASISDSSNILEPHS
jgi:hypothetical protein